MVDDEKKSEGVTKENVVVTEDRVDHTMMGMLEVKDKHKVNCPECDAHIPFYFSGKAGPGRPKKGSRKKRRKKPKPNSKTSRPGATCSWLTYEECRWLVRRRNLNSIKEFRDWMEDEKPIWVPRAPNRVYKEDWVSWNDFLGNANRKWGSAKGEWLPFYEAARYVHRLKLPNVYAWKNYLKENELPAGVPRTPDYVYRDNWKDGGYSWDAWLGKGVTGVMEYKDVLEELSVWCLVWDGSGPSNVYRLIKGVRGDVESSLGGCSVIGMWTYEDHLEDTFWDILNRHSSVYYGEEYMRMVGNVFILKNELGIVFEEVM